MNEDELFETQAWKVQLEAAKLIAHLHKRGIPSITLNILHKTNWVVTVSLIHDHADDEKRNANGN